MASTWEEPRSWDDLRAGRLAGIFRRLLHTTDESGKYEVGRVVQCSAEGRKAYALVELKSGIRICATKLEYLRVKVTG